MQASREIAYVPLPISDRMLPGRMQPRIKMPDMPYLIGDPLAGMHEPARHNVELLHAAFERALGYAR